MATLTQQLTKQIEKLTGRKDSLPDQLAKVRAELETARGELGGAALDGKPVSSLRDRIAELEAQEAGLIEAASIAEARLWQLEDQRELAERAAIIAALQEADARLGAEAEAILGQLFDLLDWSRAAAAEVNALAARARPHANLEVGPLDLYEIRTIAVGLYDSLRRVVHAAGQRSTPGGCPNRFDKLLARRWEF